MGVREEKVDRDSWMVIAHNFCRSWSSFSYAYEEKDRSLWVCLVFQSTVHFN